MNKIAIPFMGHPVEYFVNEHGFFNYEGIKLEYVIIRTRDAFGQYKIHTCHVDQYELTVKELSATFNRVEDSKFISKDALTLFQREQEGTLFMKDVA